jgi:hypothetical protein
MPDQTVNQILEAISSNPFFEGLMLMPDSIVIGPGSELESIYVIQLIAFIEEYLSRQELDVDLLEIIEVSGTVYTLEQLVSLGTKK